MITKVKNYFRAVCATMTNKGHDVLDGTAGEAYIDTGVKILIAVVIGALLMGLLVWLFRSLIMTSVGNKVNEIFGGDAKDIAPIDPGDTAG